MKLSKYFFTLVVILLTTVNLAAQETPSAEGLSLNKGPIKNQFDYVIQKSNNYKQFKVVERTWLNQLKGHVLDSLKLSQEKLNKVNTIVDKQKNEISSLKSKLENTNGELSSINQEKDSITFVGMQMTKSSYKTFMWSIVAVLVILLVFFISKFKRSNVVTVQAKKDLEEIQEEFDAHRKRALEREQKIMRKLQDEINKQKAVS
ncbi:tRNA (guanine-N1)-methyltransferase [Aureivirga sp. CE67]|uniref:tRNA (guanine-N1)-methyltransferase n=1 Tax=Aureivirga sp. CE67 TaxID=1788983 RepID=UPI0018C9C14A|nr:tRNA (guanine-N1)-methyltransferase [Aureivirga sp. CE67]